MEGRFGMLQVCKRSDPMKPGRRRQEDVRSPTVIRSVGGVATRTAPPG